MSAVFNLNKWIKISLINLLLVSFFGILMRYKIGFEFPFLDQKHLQHAHSHFAFTGWVSFTLILFMINLLKDYISINQIKKYKYILIILLISAYGMLISFTIQGYALYSIIFSTLSILITFIFSFYYIRDILQIDSIKTKHWFIASLLFNALSTLGTFFLIYMMATKNVPQHPYLASIYWFLHFQYNGWFFFSVAGLFYQYVYENFTQIKKDTKLFWLFALSCIPAFGLSILWLQLSKWLYIIVVLASVVQLLAWLKVLVDLYKISFLYSKLLSPLVKILFIIVALALSIKFILQLGSTIPSISQLAFGFRPIVIAYLHLVLLAFISMFLITYSCLVKAIDLNKMTILGIIIFCIGVFLNELVLAIQGIASFSYTIVPKTNELLFIISLMIFFGLALIVLKQVFKYNESINIE